MGIFYLEVIEKGNFLKDLSSLAKYNMQRNILFKNSNIILVYFLVNNWQKPFIIENKSKLLFVHGHCPNVTLDNYKDLDSLYGNFNIITIHKGKNTFDFVKDYTNSFDSFLFHDEKKVIITNNPLLISKKRLDLDYLSIAQYFLHYQGLFPGNYFFKKIYRIEPGFVISLQPNLSLKIEVKSPTIRKPTFNSFHKSFDEIINKSINSEKKCSVDLTGGYDTRLITACLLKNNTKFLSVVHGEGDEEVKFVKKISTTFNLELRVLRIEDKIKSILSDWKRLFFLSGGYYNFFETLKEGGRSSLRSKFSNYKVGGSMGEVIRDKWYLNKIHRSLLSETTLHKAIIKKLLDSEEIFNFCTGEFRHYLNEYKENLKRKVNKYLEMNKDPDLTRRYMDFIFSHYTEGWNGILYNFHNNIISVIAPFMDNQFYINCLFVDLNFRRNASGMTNSINKFYPNFKNIPFIDGQKCIPVKGLNLARYLYNRILFKMRQRLLSYSQKADYNHALWLKTILSNFEFKTKIENFDRNFHYIISEERYMNLLNQGIHNHLSRSQYDVLWKLISLKLCLEYDQ